MTAQQPQPAQVYDPAQQAPGQLQEETSNRLAGGQDVLLREYRCVCHNTALLPPPLVEDTLIILTGGQCDLRGRVVRPFHQHPTIHDIYLIPRGAPTEFHMTGRYQIVTLSLNPDFMATTVQEALERDPARIEFRERLAFHDPLIYGLALALRDDIAAAGLAGRLYVESLNQTLALRLLRCHSSGALARTQSPHGLSTSQLRRVTDYINDKFYSDLTLAELAAVAGYSPAYFARQFKEATGLAPHQYLIRCRVERARALLEASALTVAEVAHRVGFADQSHLNRHFKHLLGVSPGMLLHEGKSVHGLSKNVQD